MEETCNWTDWSKYYPFILSTYHPLVTFEQLLAVSGGQRVLDPIARPPEQLVHPLVSRLDSLIRCLCETLSSLRVVILGKGGSVKWAILCVLLFCVNI
jgi:hypothetical protein